MTNANRSRDRATSFGAAADVYERSRPDYPAEAIDWLLPPEAAYVIDLGAGTGKLTRQITGRVSHVVAIDPSARMLDVLRDVAGEVEAIEGTAEAIPIADGVADAVLCAQAWHWVDPAQASREVGRVLRPGGTLGLVWNFLDVRVPWIQELDRILENSNTAESIGTPDVYPPFGELERFETRWTDTLTRQGVVDLVFSRSFMITAEDDRKAHVLVAVQELLSGHGELVEMPYVTIGFRTRRV